MLPQQTNTQKRHPKPYSIITSNSKTNLKDNNFNLLFSLQKETQRRQKQQFDCKLEDVETASRKAEIDFDCASFDSEDQKARQAFLLDEEYLKPESTINVISKKIHKRSQSRAQEDNTLNSNNIHALLGLETPKRSRKVIWRTSDDEALLRLMKEYGKNWSRIGDLLGGRPGKQVRERYLNHLKPGIKTGEFTEEEDAKIMELYHQLGPKWSLMAKQISGRSESHIKNRFYNALRHSRAIKTSPGATIEQSPKADQPVLQVQEKIPLPIKEENVEDQASKISEESQVRVSMKAEQELERYYASVLKDMKEDHEMGNVIQKFKTLTERSVALEHFYTKTMQEMSQLEKLELEDLKGF